MKLKAITLALFVAGLGASFALADDGGHGKGKKAKDSSSTTATSSTSTSTTSSTEAKGKGRAKHADRKVTLCHKAGPHGKWVKVTVAKPAAKARMAKGDKAPDADGTCPAPSVPVTTTTTETTTTTTTTAQ